MLPEPLQIKKQKRRKRGCSVTVCVAAISRQTIIGASDRMLTAGNIEFEPPIAKLHKLADSICIMIAGDVSLQAEILHCVTEEVGSSQSNNWEVGRVADLYFASFETIKRRRAERAILHPLNLGFDALFTIQGELAVRLGSDVLNFEVPEIEALVTGRDATGPHIYRVDNRGVTCQDWVAFASIGVGADHANSQLMFAGHNRFRDFAPTLFLAYSAKKRSEVAPGVGKATDMFFIEPPGSDGKQYYDLPQPIIDDVLEEAYQEMRMKTDEAREQATRKIDAWMQELSKENSSEAIGEPYKDISQSQIGTGTDEPESYTPAEETI